MKKHLLNFILVCLLLNLHQSAIGQTTSDSVKVSFNKQYFTSYLKDTRDIILSPLHWNKTQWEVGSLVVLSDVLLSTQDLKIRNFALQNRSHFSDNFSKYVCEPWGSGEYSMATMALFYFGGLIYKNDRCKKTALLGTKALLITGGAVEVPKFLFQRHRPYVDNTPYQYNFDGPSLKIHNNSFPSGHATSSFAIAAIVASEYKEKPVVVIIAYTLATLCGLSRINDDEHWASDVVGGAAFGWAMGKLIYNKNNWGVKQYHKPVI
jgi:hypothetical protein